VLLLLVMRLHAAAAATSGTRELAMVSLLLLIAASFQIKHTLQLKSEKREIDMQNEKRWYIQREISQKSVGIFPLHFRRFAFFKRKISKLWPAQREKSKRSDFGRKKGAREKLLPAAAAGAAGSNWVDQDRQEPKKSPWYRIDFF
jgi:hypothetical protein